MHMATVEIDQTSECSILRHNNVPYFIKGAVGNVYLERLVEAGGNSIRASVGELDHAQSLGLSVLVGISAGKPRQGFDYLDPAVVEAQLEQNLHIVRENRAHPALLMWAIGNELEIFTTPEERAPMWVAVNDMAEQIKRVDPDHPVITVLGDQFRFMLHELDDYCPALDAVGLNAYADMLTLPEDVEKQAWKRPYLITEFGPRGHWQVHKTPWGMPIEDTSTEKAEFYMNAYLHAVEMNPRCMGSYTFHWSSHQEKTHTWYGMFLPDGAPTEAVDVMTLLWSGEWPTLRCPKIGTKKITIVCEESTVFDLGALNPCVRLICEVDVSDPAGGELKVVWELRPDVSDNPNVGGDREPPSFPIEGAVLASEGYGATIQLPPEPGLYRIFVCVYNEAGLAATANLSVRSLAKSRTI